MKCEIVSIGSELTSGQNLDTNSQWLSRRLAEMGIVVGWHTTIADDYEANLEAFHIAAGRAGLVLVTGGLGPTQDDLTREVLARAAGVALVFHPELFEQIEEMFPRRHRAMPERNRVQAFLPAGAEVLINDCGTAPGIWMKLGSSLVAAMPGVPSEMFVMFETKVKPRLLALGLGGGVLVQRKVNVFGAGESARGGKAARLDAARPRARGGHHRQRCDHFPAHPARADSQAAAQEQIAPVEQIIRQRLGELVFGVEDEELQDAVASLLVSRRQTLGVAESVTGGMVAERLTGVSGIRPWLLGGPWPATTGSRWSFSVCRRGCWMTKARSAPRWPRPWPSAAVSGCAQTWPSAPQAWQDQAGPRRTSRWGWCMWDWHGKAAAGRPASAGPAPGTRFAVALPSSP